MSWTGSNSHSRLVVLLQPSFELWMSLLAGCKLPQNRCLVDTVYSYAALLKLHLCDIVQTSTVSHRV